jgi:hypothetical protein
VVDAALNRLEVRQGAAEPAAVDVGHARAGGLVLDRLLGLLFRAHEEDRAALRDGVCDPLARLFQTADRLLQVDDVDAVALGEDKGPHTRVPAPSLVPEMRTCF